MNILGEQSQRRIGHRKDEILQRDGPWHVGEYTYQTTSTFNKKRHSTSLKLNIDGGGYSETNRRVGIKREHRQGEGS